MNKCLLFLWMTLFILSSSELFAKVQLPSVFQDHMVLQREAELPFWGRANPGEKITVIASWDSVDMVTFADSKGKWRVLLLTGKAGGPYTIEVEAENSLVVKDIMIGEVWLASGQSNMEWPLSRSENGKAEAAKADFPHIRFFQVKNDVASSPRFDCEGEWKICSRQNAGGLSAVAYYFSRELQDELDVPIGILQTDWGGTPAEAWTGRDVLEAYPEFKPMLNQFDEEMRIFRSNTSLRNPIHSNNPTTLYNAMIAPLIPYEIKGAIWYQGESNTYDPYLYRKLFPAMIYNWRRDWNKNFSFYYVQIAPFRYDVALAGTGIREAQLMSMRVPKVGMAVTMDIW